MGDIGKTVERDIGQAIIALKKGAHLLKYSRKGKPKFCPFRLSNDEKTLIWLSGKEELLLSLSSVSRIIPGQRTATFQKNPTPEKEYQSFSLIYGADERSLDLVCKDKDQAELWFVGLTALINGQSQRSRLDNKNDVDTPFEFDTGSVSDGSSYQDASSTFRGRYGSPLHYGVEKAYTPNKNLIEPRKNYPEDHFASEPRRSGDSDAASENYKSVFRDSTSEIYRVSLSSIISTSSHGSGQDDMEALGDVYMWGEGIGDGFLGGGTCRDDNGNALKMDFLLPKHLESAAVLDVHSIACGRRHAALVSRQGELFCWGQESGGRLGHGVDADVSHPQLVDTLSNSYIEHVACGEYHTCAVTLSGDLYTWGDGTRSFGLLGQGNDFNQWMPRKVNLPESIRISSVACGPWHTALISSAGQLFTFGDGTFGALGHGDRSNVSYPKMVESLKGLKTVSVSCGVWHMAAIVEVMMNYSDANACSSGKLFTWGDGDKGRLGHGNKEHKLIPTCVSSVVDHEFRKVACGHSLTVALTTSGTVFTMGSNIYGQLGDPHANGEYPILIEGKLWEAFVEEIACGSHHVAVLTSKSEVYTWGKGANGRLGHGDIQDRPTPTLVEALKDKQVKSIACGSGFTAAVCLHKWISGADQSVCSSCGLSFGFSRKRYNCYNCGHVFCYSCSSKKIAGAKLAPSSKKLYRVCDNCYTKLKTEANGSQNAAAKKPGVIQQSLESKDRLEKFDMKKMKMQGPLSRTTYMEQISKQAEEKTPRLISAGGMSKFYDRDESQYKIPVSPRTLSSTRTSASGTSKWNSPPRSTTPIPTITGISYPDFVFDELKNTNKSLTQDVLRLQAQVESLSQLCKAHEEQLKFTANELQMAKAVAAEERGKCKAAKEVIRRLTTQLKELADKVPPQGQESNAVASTPVPQGYESVEFSKESPSFSSKGLQEIDLTSNQESTSNHEEENNDSQVIESQADVQEVPPIECQPPTKTVFLPQGSVFSQFNLHRVLDASEAITNINSSGSMNRGISGQVLPKYSGNGQITVKALDNATKVPPAESGETNTETKKDEDVPMERSLSVETSTTTHNDSDMSGSENVGESPAREHTETEWVKQHEPGVYITFTSLPGGEKDLKRVRFSRKKFSEKQAEKWWAENRVQVYEQYNVKGLNNITIGAQSTPRVRAA